MMGIENDRSQLTAAAELRRHAEEQLEAKSLEAGFPREDDETRRLLHELQVHQIELEMQNSALRQARDELERGLENYIDIYEFAPVGYFTLDRDGVVREINLTAASLLGIERSRMLGRRFVLFAADKDRPVFSQFLLKVFATQDKVSCEVRLSQEINHVRFLQVEALRGKSGQECRVAVIDISERKQYEENLEILHADQAARAAELEAANIELEAFNYSVSHELRTPLNAISGYCQVLQELFGNRLDEQCRGFIQEIYAGALHMNQLIGTLLVFSSAMRVEMCRDKVDLSIMAREVALGLKVSEPERSVTFRIAEGITVDGDASLLRVVLENLIGNAWKYSCSRGEAVIEFGEMEVDGKPACFIRDNGPGFDMAQAEILFIPFQRIPGTDVAGHGIGLATVERIVRRHGGRVWAESKPGEGATFMFKLE